MMDTADVVVAFFVGILIGVILLGLGTGFDDTVSVHEFTYAQSICELNEGLDRIRNVSILGESMLIVCNNDAVFRVSATERSRISE